MLEYQLRSIRYQLRMTHDYFSILECWKTCINIIQSEINSHESVVVQHLMCWSVKHTHLLVEAEDLEQSGLGFSRTFIWGI